jgi:hypothetical protein
VWAHRVDAHREARDRVAQVELERRSPAFACLSLAPSAAATPGARRPSTNRLREVSATAPAGTLNATARDAQLRLAFKALRSGQADPKSSTSMNLIRP